MPLNAEDRRRREYERTQRAIEAAEREEALRAALARKPDPLREFAEQFGDTVFSDLHRRARKIATRPDAWPVLHRLLVHRERWVEPLEEWKPRGKALETILRSLVTHLICRYPMPSFWYEVWFRGGPQHAPMETEDGSYLDAPVQAAAVDQFVLLAQGTGMYRLVQDGAFPVPFTKRQCHAFMGQRNVNTIPHAVRWTQVRSFGGERRLAEVLCGTEWGDDLEADTEEFRSRAVQWFCAQPMLDPAQVAPLIDYINFCRDEQDEWSFKGRTARSMMRGMEEWHAELAAGRAAERRARRAEQQAEWAARRKPPPEKFEPSGIEGMYWHRKRKDPVTGKQTQEVWKVDELLSRTELAEEGSALRHCVASYAWSAARGSKSIWSLSCQNLKILTIEVHNPTKTIKQVRGSRNRLPTSGETAVVRRWAQEAGLQIAGRAVQGW